MKNIYICINLLTRENDSFIDLFAEANTKVPSSLTPKSKVSRRRPTFSTQLERKTKSIAQR